MRRGLLFLAAAALVAGCAPASDVTTDDVKAKEAKADAATAKLTGNATPEAPDDHGR